MESKPKSILILAYKFPPYKGVGARRWAKFAKYLKNNGIDVHVITANWEEEKGVGWIKEAEVNKLTITRLTSPFLGKYKKTFWAKALFHLEVRLSKLFCWTDEAYSFWLFNKRKIKKYIEVNKIDVLIASGGPFSVNYFAAKVKLTNSTIKLIQDFRDPWIVDYFHDNPHRKPQDKFHKKELMMEKYSIEKSNAVFSVAPGCLTRLQNNIDSYGLTNTNHILIENGYDNDDRNQFSEEEYPEEVFSKSHINCAHFGTVQFGREKSFYKFLTCEPNKIKLIEENIRFHFFGSFNKDVKNQILSEGYGEIVKFYEYMSPETIQKFMYFADLHLVINDEIYYYAYGTKIFDALMYKKGIMLLSKEEGLYHLIKNNELGIVTNNSEEQNKQLVNELIENKSKYTSTASINKKYDYEKHSIDRIAKRIETIFNTI